MKNMIRDVQIFFNDDTQVPMLFTIIDDTLLLFNTSSYVFHAPNDSYLIIPVERINRINIGPKRETQA